MIKEFIWKTDLQNSESNMQLIDDAIEEKAHRNFKTVSRDNFKSNRRPAVVN